MASLVLTVTTLAPPPPTVSVSLSSSVGCPSIKISHFLLLSTTNDPVGTGSSPVASPSPVAVFRACREETGDSPTFPGVHIRSPAASRNPVSVHRAPNTLGPVTRVRAHRFPAFPVK